MELSTGRYAALGGSNGNAAGALQVLEVRSGAARVEPESIRAVFFDQVFGLPAVDRITTPLLVLGADDDGLISTAEVRSTARAYGTEAVLFPRMGHNMMVEPDWRDVADHVIRWLADRHL